ncbi:MAG: hypothetical protein WDM81_03495 [Rhizomicrobium sp.]
MPALEELLKRAEAHYGEPLKLTDDARASLRAMADGDGRYLLNLVEELATIKTVKPLDTAALVNAVQKRAPLYDKSREEHYNNISALHKSIRGSDPDAALYWLARMLVGGEQPLYIARRLVRAAVEDIGLADPQALVQALAAKDMFDFLGSPEGEIALAQTVIYLASAPKSNAVYVALGAAKRAARDHGSLMPPAHILNAPTKLMKNLGYGAGYEYDHEAEEGLLPARTTSPTPCRANSSTSRRKPASNATSPSGWTIGPSCGRSARAAIKTNCHPRRAQRGDPVAAANGDPGG